MFYREAGQFKTSYDKDAAIFPIRQDRIGIAVILAVAFFAVPLFATQYVFSAILIPFLILSLAAIGLNILTGYCGQLSLGTAAFMAVGAFASYNFMLRVPGMPILLLFHGADLTDFSQVRLPFFRKAGFFNIPCDGSIIPVSNYLDYFWGDKPISCPLKALVKYIIIRRHSP